LDKHKNSEAEMRASVVEMISASVSIATGGSIGMLIIITHWAKSPKKLSEGVYFC